MSPLDQFPHGLLEVVVTLARLVLNALETVEAGLRAPIAAGRLTADTQKLLLIAMLAIFLFAGSRLPTGRLRTAVSLALVLTLAHTLEHLARG